MIRRFRPLVALLALVALSAFVAESAWTLVCPPGMEMGGSAAAAVADSGAHTNGMHRPAPAPDHSGHAPSDSPDSPACPLAVASACSGCVIVAFPADMAAAQTPVTEHEAVLLLLDRTPDLLVVAGHFRPPRA